MRNHNFIDISIIVLAIVFGISGLSFAGGGGPQDPAPMCLDPPPEPADGPVINGSYTVSKVQTDFDTRYVIHLVLKKSGEVHLYNFPLEVVGPALCDLTEEQIITNLRLLPCNEEIGLDFGIYGIPVIFSLTIDHEDMCDGNLDMIAGSIKIRVVPI